MNNNKGMTLVEIMVAISILAFLSIFTGEAIQNALSAKRKYGTDIVYQAMVRDTLKVLERDINLAFHYRNVHVELYNSAKQAQVDEKNKPKNTNPSKKATDTTTPNLDADGNPINPDTPRPDDPYAATPTTPTNPAEAATFERKKQRLFTHFIGDAQSLNFASLNNSRTQPNENSSDQMEVGYFIRDCKSVLDKEIQSKCLWRRVSPTIDDEIEEGGRESVLIEGVEEFKLRYYSKSKEDWVDSWDSKENLDAKIKNNFPDAVEATLAVKSPDNKKSKKIFKYTLVARVRFPNNPQETKGTP